MFKHLAAVFIIAGLFVGCSSKTEECVAPTIDKNLIGTWKAVVIEDGKTTDTGELIFGADGSLKDSKNLLIGTPVPKTTWKVVGGAIETTSIFDASNTVSFTFTVKENNCTKIVLDLTGLYTIELTK